MKLSAGVAVLSSLLMLPGAILCVAADERPAKQVAPSDATWVMRFDRKIDGQLKDSQSLRMEIKVKDNQLSGKYLGVESNHVLTGEFVDGETPIVLVKQTGPKGYVSVRSGKRIGENRFAGTWYDNNGSSGDFELAIEKK